MFRNKKTYTHKCESVLPMTLDEFLEKKEKLSVVAIKAKTKESGDCLHQIMPGCTPSGIWQSSFQPSASFSSGVCGDVTWLSFSLYYGHWMYEKLIHTEEFSEPFILNHSDQIIIDFSNARLLNCSTTIGQLLSGKAIYRNIFDE